MIGRPREFDRERALETALHLFWEQGYVATGTAQLAAEMGIGRQSMYGAFGDKQDLFLEALTQYAKTRVQYVIDMLEGAGSGLDRIDRLLTLWVESAKAAAPLGCLLTNSVAEFGGRDAEIAQALKGKLDRRNRAFHKALRDAEHDGDLPDGVTARGVAALLDHLGHGVSLVSRTPGGAREVRAMVTTVRKLLGLIK